MNWQFWKKKQEFDVNFVDTLGFAQESFPIRLAKNEPLSVTDHQKEKYGKLKFHLCPGIIDYARYGYIIPAWDTIKIKANRAGVVAFYYNRNINGDSASLTNMETNIVDGVFQPTDIPFRVFKADSPWKVVCNKDISAMLMPAFYHSKFLDDLHIYPGIVDYKSFSAVNIIFSAKRPCEVTINAGEPLLHVLPFHNKPISASYGMASIDELAKTNSPIYSMFKHLYRKKDSIKKTFELNS